MLKSWIKGFASPFIRGMADDQKTTVKLLSFCPKKALFKNIQRLCTS
jgi:hypothetical protein